MRTGSWMLDTFMRIAPMQILLDRGLSQVGVLIGDCRTSHGPPAGRTELLGPASVRPGTLHPCTPAGRQHISFRVHDRLTHAVLASTDLAIVGPKAAATVTFKPLWLHVWELTPCHPVAKERMTLRRTPVLKQRAATLVYLLFEAGCTDYQDEPAYPALAQAAENLMRVGCESTDDEDV